MGPQLTLYIPGPVVRTGHNSLVLLEMEGAPDELEGEVLACTAGWRKALRLPLHSSSFMDLLPVLQRLFPLNAAVL